MKTTIFTLMAILCTTFGAFGMGGQDVLVDHLQVESRSEHDVTATDDGILFAACTGDDDQTLLSIYRSADGGSKWTLWSEITPVTPDVKFNEVHLATTSGSPGSLLVAWIEKGGTSPVTGSWLHVAKAEAVETSPVWTTNEIDNTGTFIMGPLAISTVELLGPADRVCLAWRKDDDLSYATSVTGGTFWQAPLQLNLLTDGAHGLDVAADNFGIVHFTWGTSTDFSTDMSLIYYARAQNGGGTAVDWSAAQLVGSFPPAGYTYATVAVDPGSQGVVIAGSSDTGLAVVTSTDAGLNWSTIQQYPGLTRPDADWGAAGPFIGVDTDSTSGLGIGRAVMSPTASYTGTWSADLMMAETTEVIAETRLAVDPSRGGAPMLTCLQTLIGESPTFYYRLWFDAAWRDAPGYGVPEPIAPYRTSGLAMNRPILPGNMDGDSTLELVFSEAVDAAYHNLVIYDPDLEAAVFSTPGLHPSADYALLDVDGDAELEIVYFSADGDWLFARDGDGEVVSGYPINLGLAPDAGYISGAKVTGSAEDDVVVAGGNTLWVLGPGGTPRPGFPLVPPIAGFANGRVALGDVNGDGRIEMVAPFTEGLFILDRDGLLISQFGTGEPEPGSPSLHDFNDDQVLEIAYPRADGSVNLAYFDGTPVNQGWPFDTGTTGMPSQVALANVTAGSYPDLVFRDTSGVVHLMTPVATVPADWPRALDPVTSVVDPIVAQLGTNGPSVAVGEESGRLRLLEETDTQEGWSRDQTAAILAPISAADIDGDGMIEMLIPTSRAMWILDMGVPAMPGLWPISGANPGRTGCVGALAVSAVPAANPVTLDLGAAAPNPCTPATTIRFNLSTDASRASLSIYDVAGRRVSTLLEGSLPAGDHEVMWRGKDKHGNEVASGVYFYRLEVDNVQRTRSMVLVR